jgi:enoyl-CoA hydratase/carnithine racemase
MTGEFISAERAYEIGLYHRVVPAEQVLAEAVTLAETLARGPARSLAVTKRALEAEAVMSLEEALAYEAQEQARLMEHPDFREAYEAFVGKRPARFLP